MAKESKVNQQRRRIAAAIFKAIVVDEAGKSEQPVPAIAAFACAAADALIHEFDDRGWQ